MRYGWEPLPLEELEAMVDDHRPSPLTEPIPEDYRALGLYWIDRIRAQRNDATREGGPIR